MRQTKRIIMLLATLLSLGTMAKTQVTPPVLSAKEYTGAKLQADVPSSEYWMVVPTVGNPGWTDVGTHSVLLLLADADAYEWAPTEGVEVEDELATIPFTITKGANAWLTAPAMAGWKWGETASTPEAEAKFGTPQVAYNGTTVAGDAVHDATTITAAGTYTAVFTVPATANYTSLSNTVDFTVQVGEISGGGGSGTGVTLSATGFEGTYDGSPHSIGVSVSGGAGETFDITYSDAEDGVFGVDNPSFTAAGTYTVWYKISSASYAEFKSSLEVKITKASVDPPELATKSYTGARQTADVPESTLYETVMNLGGTGAGSYQVFLRLLDGNHVWSETAGVEVEEDVAILPFVIEKGTNEWTTVPALAGWKWGEMASTPVAEARFGTPGVVFNGTKLDGSTVTGASSVTAAGSYTAVFSVAETADFTGLETEVPFVVTPGSINIDPLDPTEPKLIVDDFAGTYDGDAHSITVEIQGAGSEQFTITYARTQEGQFSSDNPSFKDVCTQTVWYAISSPNFTALTNSATVTITPRAISLATISPISERTFEGTPCEPVPEVTDGTPSIITTDDYIVSYSDNAGAGTATLTLTGTNNYTGVTSTTFAIVEPPVSAAGLKAEIAWTYLKASGTYFAQIKVTCTNGLAVGISNLRYLFADRGSDVKLWDTRARAAKSSTASYNGDTYRVVELDASTITAENTEFIYGVKNVGATTIPVAERTIEMYVSKRVLPQTGNEGSVGVDDFVGYLSWTSGGSDFAIPLVAGGTAVRSLLAAAPMMTAPINPARLNASLAVGAVVTDDSDPYVSLRAFEVRQKTIRGQIEVGAGAKKGDLGVNARVTLLGTRALGESFVEIADVVVAEGGVFEIEKPEGCAFFKVKITVQEVVK